MARGARDGRKAAQSTVHPHLSVTRAGGRSLPSLELSRQHINSGARSGLVTCVLATTATRASPVVASKNKRKEINRIPAFPLYTSLSLSHTHFLTLASGFTFTVPASILSAFSRSWVYRLVSASTLFSSFSGSWVYLRGLGDPSSLLYSRSWVYLRGLGDLSLLFSRSWVYP